ncbi:SARP family transcriptional regulator [Lentzea sp. NBRC 105346]|nr:SARP family transcriptional regulator [Lentzea sp. NBRC 105346]
MTDDEGRPIALRGRHQRTLLAVLLMRAGRQVSVDHLIDALWEGTPPKSCLSNLHTYLSRLRERLDVQISHHDGRYQLDVDNVDDLDLHAFHEHARAGREAARQHDAPRAIAHFRAALALWRGRPLSDLSVPALEPEIVQLEGVRLNLVEERVDLELAAGHHADVVDELGLLAAQHPLRERLAGQLMLALTATGRQADALAVYRSTRNTLVDSLGVEPGADLQRVHEQVLRGDDTFPVCQLPPDTPDFTGRAAEIEAAVSELRSPHTVPIVVLSGEPGVGKSALAVHVAHQVRGHFPDGQLFAHLAGKEPGEVLAGLLRAAGCSGAAIPERIEERTAVLRSRLADRRVLVVLDDASSVAQVRHLLPGTPGCAVLLTSRKRLSGLPGARVFRVAPLSDMDARDLLARVTSTSRVASEAVAADRIATMCGNLPLALRIAATRLSARPHLSLRYLADRMDDERKRLDELSVGELQVRASLSLSYDALSPLARKAFRRLGMLWPCTISTWMVAALLGVDDADGVVEELVEASLLEATGEVHHRMHDLLRLYGRERASEEDQTAEQSLVHVALGLVDAAARRVPRTLLIARLADVMDPMPFELDLPADQANLIAITQLARRNGWPQAPLLVERVSVLLWHDSAWNELAALHEGVDDPHSRYVIALIHYARGRYDEAEAGFAACATSLDEQGKACALLGLAQVAAVRGDHEQAFTLADSSTVHFGATDDRHGQASALRMAAIAAGRLGLAEESLERSRAALELARDLEPGHTALAFAEVALSHLFRFDLDNARTARTEAVAMLGGHANPLHDLGIVAEPGDSDDPETTVTKRILLGLAGGGWHGIEDP